MDHVLECPICFSSFNTPMSLPCGHLYCKECLTQHINTSNREMALTSACPDCRTPFYIVLPDLTNLPVKYHRFIKPAIRRVYLHIPTTFAELKKKLEQAEQRLVDKTKECDNLKDSAAKKLEQAEQRLTEKTTECDNLKADASRLAAKSLQYYHKNAELSVEKTDLMNVIKDLEIDLYNTNESRQAEEKEEKAIQELKDATNILILELLEAEDRLRDNHIRLDDLRYEIIDLERKLSIAQERIDADAGEADAISVMINDLELESQSRLDENERFKMYNRDLRTTIYDLGRKKELAEENLKVIVARVAAALTPPQQASGSSLRKRSLSLAAPLPIASGSHLAAKPLPKRRKIKLESLC